MSPDAEPRERSSSMDGGDEMAVVDLTTDDDLRWLDVPGPLSHPFTSLEGSAVGFATLDEELDDALDEE